jgi:hypothetical protein
MSIRTLVGLAAGLVCLFGPPAQFLLAHEVIQHFPADKPAAQRLTSWRVVWGIENHAGGSEILYIKEAYFRRGPKEEEIKVIGDCRLADTFVPYNNGTRIYDISGYNFSLEDVEAKELGPACVAPPKLYDRNGKVTANKGIVAHEVHDNHLRWKNSSGKSRRGQEMTLWSVLDASNYRYIILYAFRDDGQISCRLGATAHNLFDEPGKSSTHLHSALWRIQVELGNAAQTEVKVLRYVAKPDPGKRSTKLDLTIEQFNSGKEGGIKWNPDEFTRLIIENKGVGNKHVPTKRIGYDLLSVRHGNMRLYGAGEEFTQNDFWVTRVNPNKAELRYRDVPSYVNGEFLNGPTVIWHQTALLHTIRDEDFGRNGYSASDGVALTSWTGFDLRPRNFFGSTPLYP